MAKNVSTSKASPTNRTTKKGNSTGGTKGVSSRSAKVSRIIIKDAPIKKQIADGTMWIKEGK